MEQAGSNGREEALMGELVRLMEHLRSPSGCPWDREQTHESISDAIIEEAYETVEAIEEGDPDKLKEELGDLLFQVVFQAQMAREAGRFDLADVMQAISEKMKRRHPHVFGSVSAGDSDEVLTQWHQIKTAERGGRDHSVMEGVPRKLPALMQAEEVQRRAERVGFDWEKIGDVLEKVEEELQELRESIARSDPAHMTEEIGDLLFTVANVARFLDVKPEETLRHCVARFVTRFTHMEEALWARGKRFEKATAEEMNTLWEEAKKAARTD